MFVDEASDKLEGFAEETKESLSEASKKAKGFIKKIFDKD